MEVQTGNLLWPRYSKRAPRQAKLFLKVRRKTFLRDRDRAMAEFVYGALNHIDYDAGVRALTYLAILN